MKKWLTIMILWACAAGLWSINASQTPASYAHTPIAPHSATVYPDHGTNGEATLTDSSLLLQICSIRADRTTSNPLKVKKLFLHLTGSGTTILRGQSCSKLCAVGSSSPVVKEPQSRYYVYRLRRMRC